MEESWCDRREREMKRDHFWQWVLYCKILGFWLELCWRWDWLWDAPACDGDGGAIGMRTGKAKPKDWEDDR